MTCEAMLRRAAERRGWPCRRDRPPCTSADPAYRTPAAAARRSAASRARACATSCAWRRRSSACSCAISSLTEARSCARSARRPSIDCLCAARSATTCACSTRASFRFARRVSHLVSELLDLGEDPRVLARDPLDRVQPRDDVVEALRPEQHLERRVAVTVHVEVAEALGDAALRDVQALASSDQVAGVRCRDRRRSGRARRSRSCRTRSSPRGSCRALRARP